MNRTYPRSGEILNDNLKYHGIGKVRKVEQSDTQWKEVTVKRANPLKLGHK